MHFTNTSETTIIPVLHFKILSKVPRPSDFNTNIFFLILFSLNVHVQFIKPSIIYSYGMVSILSYELKHLNINNLPYGNNTRFEIVKMSFHQYRSCFIRNFVQPDRQLFVKNYGVYHS